MNSQSNNKLYPKFGQMLRVLNLSYNGSKFKNNTLINFAENTSQNDLFRKIRSFLLRTFLLFKVLLKLITYVTASYPKYLIPLGSNRGHYSTEECICTYQ